MANKNQDKYLSRLQALQLELFGIIADLQQDIDNRGKNFKLIKFEDYTERDKQ